MTMKRLPGIVGIAIAEDFSCIHFSYTQEHVGIERDQGQHLPFRIADEAAWPTLEGLFRRNKRRGYTDAAELALLIHCIELLTIGSERHGSAHGSACFFPAVQRLARGRIPEAK